jgi:hypothetical protein
MSNIEENDSNIKEELLDSDRVADLLNEASGNNVSESIKLAKLRQVQDLILNKNPDLLDNFLDVNIIKSFILYLLPFIYLLFHRKFYNFN